MRPLLSKICTVALVTVSVTATSVQAGELHVMISGGFNAAYKRLVAKFSAATGDTVDTELGPSMGKSPEP